MEEGDTRERVAKEVRFLVPVQKSQSPQRVTYGVVLEPETEDLQGDVITAEDIERAAYDWMERSQSGGRMHSEMVEGAKVVESYIAPCDIPVETAAGPETIKKGSWVLAMRWPPEIWESIQKGELTGYSVGGTGVRLAIEKHGDHDQSTHGNWARRGYRGDPAGDGAAAEGGGTPADQGSAAARREARGGGKGGAHKVGDVVRLKEDGATGKIVDYEAGKNGSPDEYAIAPEDLEPGGPRAIWVRSDEIGAIEGPGALDIGDKVTFRDGVEAKVVGVSRGHILVEGPGVPNGTMAVGHDDMDSDGNINLDAEYKPKYRGQYERPSAYGGGLAEQDDDALDGYPSGTVDDEQLYPTGGKWAGEDDAADAKREDAEWKAGYGKDASQGWEAEAGYKTYSRGQKVRTPTGQIRTVHSQRGSQVFVDEESNGWYHPSKLWPVKKRAEQAALDDAVRDGLRDAVSKHGSHDQSSHGNWARGGKSGLDDGEEFVPGDRVKLESNEKIDWGGLEGATGKIVETKPGTLGWPTTYSVKLDREWVGWEDDDTITDLEADRLTMLRRVRKHGGGDQSPHGNWARGGAEKTPRERSWERHLTAPTPEERRQAGEDYVRYANDEDAAAMKDLLTRGHAPVDSVTRNDDGSFTVTRAFSKPQKGATEASFVRAIEYAAGQQNLTVRLLGTDEFFDSRTSESGHFMVRFAVEDKDAEYERRKGVRKHGSGDQSAHGNWARRTAETGKPYTTRDGVDIRDQPKVKRRDGGDYYETENGVTLDTRYFSSSHGARPLAHSRGHWAVFPGHDMKATEIIENAIWSKPGETLADLLRRLEPGEYVLGS